VKGEPERHQLNRSSAAEVEDDPAIDAMAKARLLPKEGRGIVLGLDRDEPVVASEPPSPGVPLDPAADVAGEKRLGIVDPEAGSLEQAQAPTPPVKYGTTEL
jgi:hypothetical protein